MRLALLLTVLGLLLLAAAPARAQHERGAELCQNYHQFSDEPPSWAAKLTQPQPDTVVVREDVQIPSADGTLISARVYVPQGFGGALPAVLVLSPYFAAPYPWKEIEDVDNLTWPDCVAPFLLQRGYAVVLADMRGTRNSGGCLDYGGRGDQEDGVALVEWIAAQKWSSGKVAMYGDSNAGMAAYAAAVKAPPALKAIVAIAPITSFYRYLFAGGARYEANTLSMPAYEYGTASTPPTQVGGEGWGQALLNTGCGTDEVARATAGDGTLTDYWRERDLVQQAGAIEAAVFHVHGTLDENVKTDHLGAMWDALERHRAPRKALVGPWEHLRAPIENFHLHAMRFLEHWLRGIDTGVMDEPIATLIDQRKAIRFADTFPADAAGARVLHAGGGRLAPAAAAGESAYQDVPGLRRDRVREAEAARVIYLSEPTPAATRISGAPLLELLAAIDRTDTDFAVTLSDVRPSGDVAYITRGYLDARLRGGLDDPQPVTPGEPTAYRIELHPREWLLQPGHRLELMIASSDSCAECPRTGVVSDLSAARVSVLEGPGATRLRLPVAPVVDVIRAPRHGGGAPPAPAQLRAHARLRGRRLAVRGTVTAGARVTVRVRDGRRSLRRRVTAERGRFAVRLRVRAPRARLRVHVRARLPDGRSLSTRVRLRRSR